MSDDDWIDVEPAQTESSNSEWTDVSSDTPTSEVSKPSLIRQAINLNNSAAGGARELIRSIGSGENAVDAYMKGYKNPKVSESLQTGAIQGANDLATKIGADKLPYAANVAFRYTLGTVPSTAGMIADIATNPAELAAMVTFERFPTLLKQVAPNVAARISEFATKTRSNDFKGVKSIGSDIKNALVKPKIVEPNTADIVDLAQETAYAAQDARTSLMQSKSTELANLDEKHAKFNSGFETKIKKLDGDLPVAENETSIPKQADEATLLSREKYFPYAKDLSSRYGSAYQKAIAGSEIDQQKAYTALRNTIERDGFLSQPEKNWTDSQRSIYELSEKYKSDIQNTMVNADPMTNRQTQIGNPKIRTTEFDKHVQDILGVKKYQPYSQSDHILTILREETSNALGAQYPKVQQVRKNFAPELSAKNEFTKIVQPFNKSRTFDTTQGVSFFSDYAKTGFSKSPDAARMVVTLKNNPKIGTDLFKPLESSNLERNTILRNQYELAIDKPNQQKTIELKYQNLNNSLRSDVRTQATVLKAMKERAASNEEIASKIKRAAVVGSLFAAEEIGSGGKVLKKILPFL